MDKLNKISKLLRLLGKTPASSSQPDFLAVLQLPFLTNQ